MSGTIPRKYTSYVSLLSSFSSAVPYDQIKYELRHQGLVFQKITGFTKSLFKDSLSILEHIKSGLLKFFAEKKVSSFTAKALHKFLAKI